MEKIVAGDPKTRSVDVIADNPRTPEGPVP